MVPTSRRSCDSVIGSPEAIAEFERYGVSRADDRFWELYDWFQAEAFKADPIHAGLFDLKRYTPHAALQ